MQDHLFKVTRPGVKAKILGCALMSVVPSAASPKKSGVEFQRLPLAVWHEQTFQVFCFGLYLTSNCLLIKAILQLLVVRMFSPA